MVSVPLVPSLFNSISTFTVAFVCSCVVTLTPLRIAASGSRTAAFP